jgi:hypothetical protein
MLTACKEVDEHTLVLSNSPERQPIVHVNKNRHLQMAEFWIKELENPDKIIMTPKKIKIFNNFTTYKQHKITFFKDFSQKYGKNWVKTSIQKSFNSIQRGTKYLTDDTPVERSFFPDIRKNMHLKALHKKSVSTRFALTVNYTHQKIVPTDIALLKKKYQIHFDRNQNSALDIATPLAILHTSKDGVWHYGMSPLSSGWVKDSDIAFGSKKEIKNYLESKSFVVTTSAKNALLIKGEYHDHLRMGVRLPLVMGIDDMMMVRIPTRDEEGELTITNATIKTSDIHKGYLPYTPRNILQQAFKFIHAPYGWGGMYGEQDCSKFLQEVYATVGVELPRNSSSQSKVGKQHLNLTRLNSEQKIDKLEAKAEIGATILHLSGHITLYLGEYKGVPYIIHTAWGSSGRHFALGRTAVTPLTFNNYLNKIDISTTIKN